MRLALLLLLMAAALTWASYQLDRLEPTRNDETVVEAGRAQAPRVTPLGTEDSQPAATTPVAGQLFRVAQAPQDQTKPKPGEQLTLTGIAGPPGARVAFVRDAADGSVKTMQVGDRIGAWRAVSIDDSCLDLRRGRQSNRVCL
ncbi:MAG: hypothetical protein FD124_1422 [Alphaproteobacteria bacterium]|nr:MAG: hypothetical protein FD160_3354 [Caulobacteraceae bacterium]TPW07065.1 MAG: hypothetical protein FD124_1422 [Alphaproteobacteria bacterium]